MRVLFAVRNCAGEIHGRFMNPDRSDSWIYDIYPDKERADRACELANQKHDEWEVHELPCHD